MKSRNIFGIIAAASLFLMFAFSCTENTTKENSTEVKTEKKECCKTAIAADSVKKDCCKSENVADAAKTGCCKTTHVCDSTKKDCCKTACAEKKECKDKKDIKCCGTKEACAKAKEAPCCKTAEASTKKCNSEDKN